MQIIKYCMLFFIFIASVTIGRFISQKYKYRLEELEEIKNSLNILKSKIKFTYEPLPEIFDEIAQNTSYNISNLFHKAKEKMEKETASIAWEKSVEEFSGNLKIEDKQVIKTLSKLLRNNRY
jgi:stage III sporulation protein AB